MFQKRFSYKNINEKKNFQIAIKFESHLKIPRVKQIQCPTSGQNPLAEAYNLNFKVKHVSLKKKTKHLIVTLASPHVHKKSREQYKLDYYRTWALCVIKNIQDYHKFLQWKLKLYELHLDQGLHITFTYSKALLMEAKLPVF